MKKQKCAGWREARANDSKVAVAGIDRPVLCRGKASRNKGSRFAKHVGVAFVAIHTKLNNVATAESIGVEIPPQAHEAG